MEVEASRKQIQRPNRSQSNQSKLSAEFTLCELERLMMEQND
jgi:hypothetical protein